VFLVAGSGLTDSIHGPKVNKVIQQWQTNFCTSRLTGVCSAHRGKLARGSSHLHDGGHNGESKTGVPIVLIDLGKDVRWSPELGL